MPDLFDTLGWCRKCGVQIQPFQGLMDESGIFRNAQEIHRAWHEETWT